MLIAASRCKSLLIVLPLIPVVKRSEMDLHGFERIWKRVSSFETVCQVCDGLEIDVWFPFRRLLGLPVASLPLSVPSSLLVNRICWALCLTIFGFCLWAVWCFFEFRVWALWPFFGFVYLGYYSNLYCTMYNMFWVVMHGIENAWKH